MVIAFLSRVCAAGNRNKSGFLRGYGIDLYRLHKHTLLTLVHNWENIMASIKKALSDAKHQYDTNMIQYIDTVLKIGEQLKPPTLN